MAYIESAYYGDEKSQRNATKVLADKITGSTVDVDVNEQLIPPFEVVDKVEINDREEKKIREQAATACGGVDQACIDRTQASLRQNLLVEKQNQANSTATAIKGRRLTVNIIDENGKRKRIVIPDGQKFKYDNLTVNDPSKGPLQLPSADHVQNQLKILGTIALSTMLYVFSVAATYTLFMQKGAIVAVPLTAISIFIPYSGFVIMFFYFMISTAINTYVGKV